MEHVEEQTKDVGPTRPRLRIKKAQTVTLLALAVGIVVLPWWWWFTIAVTCLVLHLMLTIGHWYEIAETLWEENLDLTVERDVAERRADRLEDELAQFRRKAFKTVDVPLIRNGEIPQQRRGDS